LIKNNFSIYRNTNIINCFCYGEQTHAGFVPAVPDVPVLFYLHDAWGSNLLIYTLSANSAPCGEIVLTMTSKPVGTYTVTAERNGQLLNSLTFHWDGNAIIPTTGGSTGGGSTSTSGSMSLEPEEEEEEELELEMEEEAEED